MLFVLILLFCSEVSGHIYVEDVYKVMDVAVGDILPYTSIQYKIQSSLRGFGIAAILSHLGIWAIKRTFLLFFKSFRSQINSYLVFWWIVLVFTVACAAVSVSIVQY